MSFPAHQLRHLRHVRYLRCHQTCVIKRRALTTSAARTSDSLNPQQSKPDVSDPSTRSSGVAGHGLEGKSQTNDTDPFSILKRLRKQDSPGKQSRFILGHSADIPIRTRFAPSPTGYLHLGSLRTALFNKLVAGASKGGSFILRIEDTDQNRLVQDAEQRLTQDLTWAGLTWDEGPDRDGPYGPYRQSERLPIYHDHSKKLLADGYAYRCFCSVEKLDAERALRHEAGLPSEYSGTCRNIEASESDRRAANGESHTIRFRSHKFGRVHYTDSVVGTMTRNDVEDDFILMKSDGFPTYHFANVVDDHLMKITHVIRGEEWLPSTPKHQLIYRAFGWTPPIFAHLGLLVHPDGNKLSKRDGSISLDKYKKDKIFPMALLRWLGTLGSSFKQDSLPRSVKDLTDWLTYKFTRGGIKLNPKKLMRFQQLYRNEILHNPNPNPEGAAEEARLIDEYLIQPTLHYIDTDGMRDPRRQWITPAWERGILDLIPTMRPDDSNRARYLLNVMSAPRRSESPHFHIHQTPYYFWRVPEILYQASLARGEPNERVLGLLDDAIKDDSLWEGNDFGTEITSYIVAKLNEEGLEQPIVHDAIRLVITGDVRLPTTSSGKMITLLGRDEMRYRLSIVQDLIKDMRAGGPDVKEEWAKDELLFVPQAKRDSSTPV